MVKGLTHAFFLLSVVAQQTDLTSMMAWLCTAGFFRGIALSNFTLTVSEYSSLEKLPAAFGKKLSRLENAM